MPDNPSLSASTLVKPRRVAFAIMVAFISLLIVYLGLQVHKELRALSTARSDVVQWNLSQAEVEHYALINALTEAVLTENADLKDVHKWFDILYSRIETIGAGSLYASLLRHQPIVDHLIRLRMFLVQVTPLMDGDEATLRRELPNILRNAWSVRTDVRNIALEGVKYFSVAHGQQREGLAATLLGIAILAGFLLVLQLFLIRVLDRLNKQNNMRAWQNNIARARMQSVISTSLDAILVTTRDGQIIEYNGAAEHIFEHAREDILGRSVGELITSPHLISVGDGGLDQLLRLQNGTQGGRQRLRVQGRRRSGQTFPAELSIDMAEGANEATFVSFVRDISKEVQAENELRKARDSAIAGEQSKSRLLAVMSHEMRTPLNGMLGTIELLGGTPLQSDQKRYLRIIRQSGTLLLSHVNDVLDISRIEAGRIDLDETVFDLREMINELLDQQKVLGNLRGNVLAAAFSSDHAIPVRTDQLRLKQLLLNLIGNANKFTRDGEITIEVEVPDAGERLEIRVIDTGIGIEPEDLERVFDDFTTLDSSYRRRADGTGLGLGIVRRVSRAMGGEVSVESEPNEGTMFTLSLPIFVQGEVGRLDEPEPTGEDVRSDSVGVDKPSALNVLVVEDNEINRIVVRDLLRLDDHTVTLAEDGHQGIEIASAQPFDLILMDISMPDLSGTDVAQMIRGGDGPNRRTPIYALTAHAMEEDIQRFREAGMERAIIKPVSQKSLRTAFLGLEEEKRGHIPGTPHAVLNRRTLDEFAEQLGEQKFRSLLQKFLADTEDGLAQIERLSPAQAAKVAHRLSGSVSLFGAEKLCCLLHEYETAAKTSNFSKQGRLVREFIPVWGATREALDGFIAGLQGPSGAVPPETSAGHQ